MIFSDPMVRAIKNMQPGRWPAVPIVPGAAEKWQTRRMNSKHGTLGLRVRVQEVWGVWPGTLDEEKQFVYRSDYFPGADDPKEWPGRRGPFVDFVRWRSPMFMPRDATRMGIQIMAVRIQHLQEITNEDALAEGIFLHSHHGLFSADHRDTSLPGGRTPIEAYKNLWNRINGKMNPWASNPKIYVLEFMRTR